MRSAIFEFFCAILIVGIFVVFPWMAFLSIGGHEKAISTMWAPNHTSWWLMTLGMARYAVRDILQSRYAAAATVKAE